MVKCSKCEEEFDNKGVLMTHARQAHKRVPSPPPSHESSQEEINYDMIPSEKGVTATPRQAEAAPQPPPQAQQPAGDSIDALLDSQILNPQYKMRARTQQAQQQPQKVVYVNTNQNQAQQPERNIALETAIMGVTNLVSQYLQMKMTMSSGPSFWEKTGPKLFENYYMNLTKERGKAVGKRLPGDDMQGSPDIMMEYMQEQERRIKQMEASIAEQREMSTNLNNVPSENASPQQPAQQAPQQPEAHTHKTKRAKK